MVDIIKELLVYLSALELCFAANGVPDARCTDSKGKQINSGERFFPGPERIRPCLECLCVRGNAALCGIAMCVGQVDCSIPKWRVTMCCQPECINQKRLILSDIRLSSSNDSLPHDPRVPYQNAAGYFDTGSVFGMDDANYLPPLNYDTFAVDPSLQDVNSTVTGSTRQQSLPSPYYPILIGLISCAPVALCIISINALRKYFALRGQCNHGRSFFPTRRRLRRGRYHGEPNVVQSVNIHPTVYLDPPPAYKDLDSFKLKHSEDLPKYEDVLKHDEQAKGSIFTTAASVQFSPPERIHFSCFPSSSDTEASTSAVGVPDEPATTVTPVDPTPSDLSTVTTPTHHPETVITVIHPEIGEIGGIDNPALDREGENL